MTTPPAWWGIGGDVEPDYDGPPQKVRPRRVPSAPVAHRRVHAIECDLPPDCSCVGVMTPSTLSVMTPDYRELWKQAEQRRREATSSAEKREAFDETMRIYHQAGWTAAEFLEISRQVTAELRGAPLTKEQEPLKRGSFVVDAQGRMWRRETKLWHHQQRRRRPSNEPLELFEGRYVWSVLVDEYGPLWEVKP